MSYHNDLGKLGEHLALAYLEKLGYKILAHNFYYQKAEIDIIAVHEGTLIIVEVKTRNSNFFGNPQEFVNANKIALMVKAADYYIQANSLEMEVRFDIIAIIKNKAEQHLEHYKDAFYYF
ncbi:MAG: YraN family protein [Gilvibacter sp.]